MFLYWSHWFFLAFQQEGIGTSRLVRSVLIFVNSLCYFSLFVLNIWLSMCVNGFFFKFCSFVRSWISVHSLEGIYFINSWSTIFITFISRVKLFSLPFFPVYHLFCLWQPAYTFLCTLNFPFFFPRLGEFFSYFLQRFYWNFH